MKINLPHDNPVIIHILLFSLLPSPSSECPIDNPIICDAIMDLGYENNMFRMLGGSVHNYASLGYFRGHDLFIYCVCLKDLPRKGMWTTFFTPCYDFSKAFDKIKMALIVFGLILVIASNLVFSKLWSH